MLRSEHVIARVVRGHLVPHSIPPGDKKAAGIAEDLISTYQNHLGEPRAALEKELTALEEELGPRLDPRRGFRIVRALAKVLDERAEWTPPTKADVYTIRTRLFEVSASLPELPAVTPGLLEGQSRTEIIAQVSRETGVGDPAALMYADRRGAELLSEFDRPPPADLIERYNLAQAQGTLYSAKDLTVNLGHEADARLVFQYVKKLALIYALEQTQQGYRLRLDGPLSLFGPTRKYGVRLARFLPGLLLTAPWSLHASVSWRGRDAVLELDSKTPHLASHYTNPGKDEEIEEVRGSLIRSWERAKETNGWQLREGGEILPLPSARATLIPDFKLLNERTGEIAYLEILGFWSSRHLIERTEMLREANSKGYRVLVTASERLGASPEALAEAVRGGVIPFKGRLNPKTIVQALHSAWTDLR